MALPFREQATSSPKKNVLRTDKALEYLPGGSVRQRFAAAESGSSGAHRRSTNRGFILTSDRSPQQSDRRFRRYTVLRWCVIEAGLRQSTLTKFAGRVEAKAIARGVGSSHKLGIK